MPMIETTTIRFAPAMAPARCRVRADAVKNAVASSWSGEGPVAVSMMALLPQWRDRDRLAAAPLTTPTPMAVYCRPRGLRGALRAEMRTPGYRTCFV